MFIGLTHALTEEIGALRRPGSGVGAARGLGRRRQAGVDLHAISEREDGTDLIVEVKSWEREPTRAVVAGSVRTKEALAGHLDRKTGFRFYSESGLGEEPAAMLAQAGVMIVDAAKLAGYELSYSPPRRYRL